MFAASTISHFCPMVQFFYALMFFQTPHLLSHLLCPANPFSCCNLFCPVSHLQCLKLLQMPSLMLWCILWISEPAHTHTPRAPTLSSTPTASSDWLHHFFTLLPSGLVTQAYENPTSIVPCNLFCFLSHPSSHALIKL